MKPHETIAAILRLWPQLPGLAKGLWPSLYWQLVDGLRAFAAAADQEGQAAAAIALLRLLRAVPEVRPILQQALKTAEAVRGPGELEGIESGEAIPVSLVEVQQQVQVLLHPPTVDRYTDIHLPSRVQMGQRFPVIVGLTRSPSAESVEVQAIQAQLNQLIRVVLNPRSFDLLGERTRTLRVEGGKESEPVVFYLRATQTGTQSILIDFWSESHLLASSTLFTKVLSEAVPAALTRPAPFGMRVGDYLVPHPDLIMRISTGEGRLAFDLHFADTTLLHIDGDRLRADPEQYRYHLIREIENLARGKDADGYPLTDTPGQPPPLKVFIRQLEKIGQRLYRELFPEALRREYRRFHRSIRTLEIVSDEPWIPWELIKPYDDEIPQEIIDDDFLCMQFDLTRWVESNRAPAAEIALKSLACITPTDAKLPEAMAEHTMLRDLAKSLGLQDLTPEVATCEAVEALLKGGTPVSLWHFACHGDFDSKSPDNSPLFLQSGRPLRPNDIVGPAQTRLRTDRPLVFLNACRIGETGLSLTGLGGWAKVLVQNCKVGALLAPMWSVNDKLARQFAEKFYDALQKPGCTLAQAARQARQALREAALHDPTAPQDPTWLAYSVYAHPNARAFFSAGT